MVEYLVLGTRSYVGECICYVLCVTAVARGWEKKLLSHHDFRKSIALAWINPMYHYRRCQETATTKITTNTNEYCSIFSRRPKRKYGGSSTVSSISGVSDESSFHSTSPKKSKQSGVSSIKAPAITSNYIPPTVRFKMRLDANYEHLQYDNCKKNSRCGLHL